jgi:hypothetical protein
VSRREHIMGFIDWLDQRAEVGLLDPAIISSFRSLAAVYLDDESRRFAERVGCEP